MRQMLRWVSALAYAGAISVLLLSSGTGPGWQPFPQFDKVAHFIAMGILSVALTRALTNPLARNVPGYAWLGASLFSLVYATVIEILQRNLPGRDYSGADILAGAVGIILFTYAWVALRPRFRIIA